MNNVHGRFSTAAKRWAGIGPYYAMFPSAFCDAVVEKYCKKGGTVLDPFAGRGTALHSAAATGRHAVGIELNPVGWIYAQTKLSPANRDDVDRRLVEIHNFANRYSKVESDLPVFFRHCFSQNVRQFLLSARDLLNWRQNSIDRTLMAFLLVHLHGKSTDSLSNQLRQTKAMAPKYAVAWWKERGLTPPKIDPIEFFRKKFDWRYAKGIPRTKRSKIYLGDSTNVLWNLRGNLRRRGIRRPSLLLTSPPYFGVTNYHYDQWLRLWLLGGPPTDQRTNNRYAGKHRGKFANQEVYRQLLITVFARAARLIKSDCTVYVRTDRRKSTLAITKQVLKTVFPLHQLKTINRPIKGKTQTRLFGNRDPRLGEVDLVLTQ
jgi:DNA modification methylase